MKSYLLTLLMNGLLFIGSGLAAWLTGILILYFQISWELTVVQTPLVTFSLFIVYVVMAKLFSRLLKKIGFRNRLVPGLVIMCLAGIQCSR